MAPPPLFGSAFGEDSPRPPIPSCTTPAAAPSSGSSSNTRRQIEPASGILTPPADLGTLVPVASRPGATLIAGISSGDPGSARGKAAAPTLGPTLMAHVTPPMAVASTTAVSLLAGAETAAAARAPNPTESLLMELSRQQAHIDRLMQQHAAFEERLESSLEQQQAGVQNVIAISASLEQQQAGVHNQILTISARQDAAEGHQEALLVNRFTRMQSMMQQTIQQSIGAILPQLTQLAAGGGSTQPGRLHLVAPPAGPTGSNVQGGGQGVVGGRPSTPQCPLSL